jgi:imidazolonepropionase
MRRNSAVRCDPTGGVAWRGGAGNSGRMTTAPWDALWLNLSAATMVPGEPAYGLIADAAVGIAHGRLAYVGPRGALPDAPATLAREVHDGEGGVMTPGLIDCHTHLVYGGNRAREFELRLAGASYEAIARGGGGILATVRATRALDEDALVAAALPRLDALLREGVTTIEIKSGYGLSTHAELRQLRAARRLGALRSVDVRTTFLGAHAVPPEYDADTYIDLILTEMLPLVAAERLADAVDAFCDTIGFTLAQTRKVFARARELGLPVKLHAEQLSNQGGAALAAEFSALSADHLEWLDEAGATAMARAGTVAVLLPGAFYTLRETRVPPVDLLRERGVPIALATDCNPGSAPVTSLLLMLNMGCTLFRLTPEEALAGVTRSAARALGLADRGVLREGLRADAVLWRIAHPAELAYEVGLCPRAATLRGGEVFA